MNKTQLETFRGLVNQFDFDSNNNIKLSCLNKVLEDAMSFLSSLLDTTINADISEGYLLNHSKTKAENFSTIYVLSDLFQNEDNDLVIVKNLYLSKAVSYTHLTLPTMRTV